METSHFLRTLYLLFAVQIQSDTSPNVCGSDHEGVISWKAVGLLACLSVFQGKNCAASVKILGVR